MLSIDLTFLWTAINLVVLFLFMRKFLFGRVTKFMDDRNAAIEADLKKGADAKAEGEQYKEEYTALVKDAAAERARTLEAARVKAAAHYDKAVDEARCEAARIVQEANEQAQTEREKAMASLRDDVASLALAAATKVVQANMDTQKNRQLVDEMLDEIEKSGGAA